MDLFQLAVIPLNGSLLLLVCHSILVLLLGLYPNFVLCFNIFCLVGRSVHIFFFYDEYGIVINYMYELARFLYLWKLAKNNN